MIGFDTILIADWSAGKRAPQKPSKDAIWLGIARQGVPEEPVYCRTRADAESWLATFLKSEAAAGRRVLAGFDFPFGYPKGFAARITGSDDPFDLWDWLEARITDAPDGANNRYDIAAEINGLFDGPGPFWGKPNQTDWPEIPYRKSGIVYEKVAERRTCDHAAAASSSCFQLAFPPTVGGQILMGLPTLSRLRRGTGAAVWPFENTSSSAIVLAEIWPGLIEPAVKDRLRRAPDGFIRDREQVLLLATAISRMPADELARLMAEPPEDAQEEAWILGAGHKDRLVELATFRLQPPPLRDDCFALPAGVDWTPVDAALGMLRDRLSPVVGTEGIALRDGLGRVLAAPLAAKRANPPEANTAVDGYGFAYESLGEGDQVLPLVEGRSAAGVPFAGTVPKGHAIRVLTGAALPEGVDTVILEEDVTLGTGEIAFRAGLKPGANTRRAGEDVEVGDTILPAGRRLTPADLALAAATGQSEMTARERLRVAVISTGDELVEAGQDAAPGQIYDANRPMLLGLVRQFGYDAVDLGRVPDDRENLRAALDEAAREADVILTSGGASAGDEDHVSALLTDAGAMAQWRIALKPGRPLALGLWQDTPVFGLPGNPVAALVCTLIFARPAMRVLSGQDWQDPQGYLLPAAFEKKKKPGRREYLRARVRDGQVEVFKSEGSGRISGLSWAEGLVELPDGAVTIKAGTPVRYIPFASFT